MTYNNAREQGPAVGAVTVEEIVPVLPAGLYQARFAAIREERNEQGTFWLWTFVARSGDLDVEITATTSPRITPRTKAAKFLAGLGQPVEIGATVDFDALLDMPCQIMVTINDMGYSRIETVLPMATK